MSPRYSPFEHVDNLFSPLWAGNSFPDKFAKAKNVNIRDYLLAETGEMFLFAFGS